MKTYYVTTPIYYVNAAPHVGHAYTTIAADALTRVRRLQGKKTFFLTGTDEHGQNIAQAARAQGIAEQAYTDQVAAQFRALWQRLGIEYDDFIRTTEDRHKRGVLKIWSRLVKATAPNGEPAIYRAKYAGWYCQYCEAFKTADDVEQPGNLCKDHKRPCEWTEEENFFFRLSAYSGWLKSEIESGSIRIDPETRRNEVLAVLDQGLQDFSLSRARVKWGIPVPEDPSHVFYVWVDALSNYITALGYADDKPAYKEFWESSEQRLHLIGKEIIRFHCLYWPAILKAADLPRPNRIFAHGWLTKGGEKLSKTRGIIIDTDQLIGEYGVDAVRYFFLREGSFGQDWDFTDAAFLTRYNADLANDLGNLGSRTFTMILQYCGGKVPPRVEAPADATDPALVLERYERLDFAGALSDAIGRVSALNKAIVQFEPWVVYKDPARRGELEAFLYRLLEGVRLATVLFAPVMPTAAERIFKMMGIEPHALGPDDLKWGRLEPGQALGRVEPVFPRKEKKKEPSVSETPSNPPAAPAATAPAPAANETNLIDISEFGKVELKVGRIAAAERIEKADKLLKLQVELGEGDTRQIVAGIALAYAPETLVGKKIAVVANLKPAKLRGVESHGMLLAATLNDKPVLLTFDDTNLPAGTRIK
jgi:methionyl-tRNA synthetase